MLPYVVIAILIASALIFRILAHRSKRMEARIVRLPGSEKYTLQTRESSFNFRLPRSEWQTFIANGTPLEGDGLIEVAQQFEPHCPRGIAVPIRLCGD